MKTILKYFSPFLFLCFACGEESDPLDGYWYLNTFGDAYDTWRISGDTIFVNEGKLFQRRGVISNEEDGSRVFTISEGLYRLQPDALIGADFVLSPEPGSTTNSLTLTKAMTVPEAGYFAPVSVSFSLPEANAAKPVSNTYAAHIFLGPEDERTSQTMQPYAMQLGKGHHLARINEVEAFMAHVEAYGEPVEGRQLTAMLYIDREQQMEDVYALTDELRRSGRYQVVYVTNGKEERLNNIGLERNLFLFSNVEGELFMNPDLDLEDLKANPNRRQDFYDRLMADSLLRVVQIDSTGNLLLDGEWIDNGALCSVWEDILDRYSNQPAKPPIVITAHQASSYEKYVLTLSCITEAYNKCRDRYCQNAFGGDYATVVKNHQNPREIEQLISQRYLPKIIEMNPFVYGFYATGAM